MEREDAASQVDAVEAPQVDAGQSTQESKPKGAPPVDQVTALNRENAKWRNQVRELEAKVKEFEDARLSEAEKLQKQTQAAQAAAQAAQEELRKARFEAALAMEAAKAGVSPALLARLVDPEYDEDGLPTNVAAAVAKVLAEYPQLKPAAPAPAPAPAPNSNPTNPARPGKLTVDDLKHMSPAEINARWDDVQAVMKTAGR